MREIPTTTSGKVILVDDADYEEMSLYVWRADYQRFNGRWYASRNIYLEGYLPSGKHRQSKQYMHTLLTGYRRTDHIDLNGLNNQRANLREVSHGQNMMNREKLNPGISASSTPYKGVSRRIYRDRPTGRYQATISLNKEKINLGDYDSAWEAAEAYNRAALEMHGEYARLNVRREEDGV